VRRILRNLIDGGVRPSDPRFCDVKYMRRMCTLNLMVLALLAACPMTVGLLLLLLLLGGGGLSMIPVLIVSLLGVLVYAGIRHGLPLESATHLLVTLIMAILAERQAELGGLEMVGQAWTYLPPIVAGLLLGVRGAAVYPVLLSLQIGAFAFLQASGVRFSIPIPPDNLEACTAGVQILCAWAIFALVAAFLSARTTRRVRSRSSSPT